MSDSWLPTLVSFAPECTRARLQPEDWHTIEKAYHDPLRAYHNLEHLCELGQIFAAHTWQHPDAVFNAILFHDFVYQPYRKDNEVRSAQAAAKLLQCRFKPDELNVERVEYLICLTARHGSLCPSDVDAEAAQFLDADMAIVGAAPERYQRYANAVAHEYRALPKWLFRRKRAEFLESLEKRPRLFLSDAFHRRLDAHARENIRRELQQLKTS